MGLTKKQTIFIISGFISVVAIAIVVAGLATNWVAPATTSSTTSTSTGSSFNNSYKINPIPNASTASQTSLDESTTGTTVQKPQTISYYNFPASFDSFKLIYNVVNDTDQPQSLTFTVSSMTKQTSKNLADYSSDISADDCTGNLCNSPDYRQTISDIVDTTQLIGNMDPDETFLYGYDGVLSRESSTETPAASLVFTEINNQVKLYVLAIYNNNNSYVVQCYSDATKIQDSSNILLNFADKPFNNPQYIIDEYQGLSMTTEFTIQL